MSLIEARVVTAPAKIVLAFARDCRPQIDLTLATFVRGHDHSAGNPLIEAARSLDIAVVTIPEAGRFDRSALAELKRVCQSLRPHIVQSNSVKSHFLVSLLRNRDFGWLAFHHGYTAEDLKMKLYNQLDRWSLRSCDRVVTVCQAFAHDLEHMGVNRSKISVIPNGIQSDFLLRDEAAARATRARFGLAGQDLVVLSAGRLSPEKGHRYLIDAVAKIKSAGSPAAAFKVLIAGDGLLRSALAEQIKTAGLEDQVLLIGHESDIRPLFMIADVFVLPSLSEGSPMVLLEGMAARVPVLTTRVGGIPEAVTDDQTALLVPPADADALGAALLRLLEEPGLRARLAAAGRERVTTAYSPELYNQRVLSAFESVLHGGNPSLSEGVRVRP